MLVRNWNNLISVEYYTAMKMNELELLPSTCIVSTVEPKDKAGNDLCVKMLLI
jgi:hypothetical protein